MVQDSEPEVIAGPSNASVDASNIMSQDTSDNAVKLPPDWLLGYSFFYSRTDQAAIEAPSSETLELKFTPPKPGHSPCHSNPESEILAGYESEDDVLPIASGSGTSRPVESEDHWDPDLLASVDFEEDEGMDPLDFIPIPPAEDELLAQDPAHLRVTGILDQPHLRTLPRGWGNMQSVVAMSEWHRLLPKPLSHSRISWVSSKVNLEGRVEDGSRRHLINSQRFEWRAYTFITFHKSKTKGDIWEVGGISIDCGCRSW